MTTVLVVDDVPIVRDRPGGGARVLFTLSVSSG
jgi:hypothetical protein